MHGTIDPGTGKNACGILVCHTCMQRKGNHPMNRAEGRIELEGGVAQPRREAVDILTTFSQLRRKAERQMEQESAVHPQ